MQQVFRRKAKRSQLSPYSSPNKLCQPPIPKIQRRARSGVESACTNRSIFTQIENDSTNTRSAPLSAWGHLDVSSFEMSPCEMKSLEDLLHTLCMYQLTKHVFSKIGKRDKSVVLLDLHQFLILRQSFQPQPEKSEVVFLQVLDAIADHKDTVIFVRNDLHTRFIKRKGMKHLLVEGDAKLYEVLQSVKFEYGVEYSYLIPMLGDWHLLKNYQIALVKPYFEAGLKELAQVAGYPVAAIQTCGQFKRTHRFLLEAWESIYQVMISKYFQCHENDEYPDFYNEEIIAKARRLSYKGNVSVMKL